MKRFLFFIACLTAALGFSAALEAPDALTLIDDRGTTLRLSRPAKRIISLEPSITETLYIIGQEDKLAAVALAERGSAWPETVKDKPSVGSIRNVSVETLVSLAPDLVLGSAMSERGLAAVSKLGIPTAFISPNSTAEILNMMKVLGRILGGEEKALAAAADYSRRVEEIQKKQPEKAKTGFFVYSVNPIMVFGSDSLPCEILGLAGIRNPLPKVSFSQPIVSAEEILSADPDYVFLAMAAAASYAEMKTHPFWGRLRAVKNGNVMAPPAEHYLRPSPRVIGGVESFYAFVYGGGR
ncbi:MAG: ABC transporter substrate-binding protein [Spirochaetia bacterium]|nr:ABC transporter substrate-binding protein [Spirochaetia bacterium]